MKVGINGTGIMARAIIKLVASYDEFKDIEIVQINGRSMSLETLRDRLLFSSSQRHSNLDIQLNSADSELIVNKQSIKYTATTEPEKIEWLPSIELILETTGKFRDISNESADPRRHFKASEKIKGVIISAPGKGGIEDFMWLATPNLQDTITELLKKDEPFVIGGASCTTTAAVPLIDTLDEVFSVKNCFLTTIHAVTRSQDILDGSKGWSAFNNQLHSTGATKSTNRVLKKAIPMDGIAYRVSDLAGSFIQIDAVVEKSATKEKVLAAFKNSKYAEHIAYPEVTNPPSVYVLGSHKMVMLLPDEVTVIGDDRVILRGLYDNEEGYVSHFLQLVKEVISHM
jgi:glyceraldehyde 3-phosphate dehydrogenase